MPSAREWLTEIGLGGLADTFEQNRIDLDLARDLTNQDLRDLGITALGDRKRLLRAISSLRSKPAGTAMQSGPSATASSPAEGERRQLTVMFCDMVGFTQLANRVDPEILQVIMRTYEETCAVCVTRYEGYVYQRLGDGIVAFFGYPLAHESEAERAIHAGLAILEALAVLGVPEIDRLEVRIGIATGIVVMSSTGKGAVGETLNLASRLQGIAPINALVVSERVRRLASGRFLYEDLGTQSLKGIPNPVPAFRVLGVSAHSSRYAAATEGMILPYVGREQELALMLQRWRLSRDGEGQVVLLSGEPGIGKSRTLRALQEELEPQGANSMLLQCSPYHVQSALYPVIDYMGRMLGLEGESSLEVRLEKLEEYMATRYGRPTYDVRYIGGMMNLPVGARYEPSNLTPQRLKDETLRSLVDLTEAIAHQQPTVLLFEDIHWADPTSLELLDLLINRTRHLPLLIVLTHRPSFVNRWTDHGHVTVMSLARLSRSQSAELIAKHIGNKELPKRLHEQILDRTDGVPLFVEELTKSILESGDLTEVAERYEYSGKASSASVPVTLRDLLVGRLDRYPKAKEVAQIGAAIGREFSHELVAFVWTKSLVELESAIRELVESGLAFQHGSSPSAIYTFKHALVQDAAYDTLLKSRRQEIHSKIALAYEKLSPRVMENEPEILAHHRTKASDFAMAARYWISAAQRAGSRYAISEAVVYAKEGLACVAALPESTERLDLEIALQAGLIEYLRTADRSDEALQVSEQSRGLATAHSRHLDLARIHHSRGNIYFPLGRIDLCLVEHELSLRHAKQAGSFIDEARALGGIGDAQYMAGRMISAHDQFEQCVQLCREHALSSIEASYLPMRAATHMYGLRFEASLADCNAVARMVASGGPPRAEVVSNSTSIFIALVRKDFDVAVAVADRTREIVTRMGLRRFVPLCNHPVAHKLLSSGDRTGAVSILEESLAAARETGVTFWGPIVLGVIALATDSLLRRQEVLTEAQSLLDRGCVSHNYFWFYRDAIEVSLIDQDWEAADMFSDRLSQYFDREPMPWSTFVVRRGRVLAKFGRGLRTVEVKEEVDTLLDLGRGLRMNSAIEQLENALQEIGRD